MDNRLKNEIWTLCRQNKQYPPDAYFFLIEALDVTLRSILQSNPERMRHVSGQELLTGIKKYALAEFGPLAYTVFKEWGIHKTEDFGTIVFNLVEQGTLGASKSDSRKDFKDGFDFEEELVKPFEPQCVVRKTVTKTGASRKPQHRRCENGNA